MTRADPRLAVAELGLREQGRDPPIRGRLHPELLEHLDRARGIPLLQQRLGLQDLRVDRGRIELQRHAHLGEHLVEPLERQQGLAEHDAPVHRRRPAEQSQAADLDGLLILTGVDQRLAARDEVALRHLPEAYRVGVVVATPPPAAV